MEKKTYNQEKEQDSKPQHEDSGATEKSLQQSNKDGDSEEFPSIH